MDKSFFAHFNSRWVKIDKKCYEIESLSTEGILTCYLLNKNGQRNGFTPVVYDLNKMMVYEITVINRQPEWF